MTEIKIPFMGQFRESMLNSRKTVTTRTKIYGERGDQFEAFGAPFILLNVVRLSLDEVAGKWHNAEGFDDPEGFIKIWKQLHRRKGYDGKQIVFLHQFIRRNLLLATTSWPGHRLPESEIIKW